MRNSVSTNMKKWKFNSKAMGKVAVACNTFKRVHVTVRLMFDFPSTLCLFFLFVFPCSEVALLQLYCNSTATSNAQVYFLAIERFFSHTLNDLF